MNSNRRRKELDAKRELIKVQPRLDAKQPYSQAANLNGCVIWTPSRAAQRIESQHTGAGGFETGLQSPENRTGSSLYDGTRFLEGGVAHLDGI
ncbi:hypothetical protein IVA86_28855 [Bradyrhizobium sp. 146]|uniref:hypothetical protein n=1 Tax=Bradyrhizobium sp. 146 TaxID=2782622 RepID=UPI001FFA0F6F|nr:hypothetical protein [Bradyrhizobium sp. 146]MCK1705299.1 hypothetical protein [Bradyrhizobium sp. 146]